MLPASFYRQNRQTLLKSTNLDCIVLTAAGLLQRNSDVAYTFRQDSNFLYLSGCNEPDLILVITKNKHFIVLPKRDKHRDVWEGVLPTDEIVKKSGVDDVLQHAEGWKIIKHTIANGSVGTIFPPKKYISSYGMYTNPAKSVLLTKIKRHSKHIVDIRLELAHMRSIKTAAELKLIQKAIDITEQSLKIAMQSRGMATYEYDLEHTLTHEFMRLGAEGHSFSPIVATDKKAAIIHNISNNSELINATMVLFDIGAEVGGYAADISRVYALQKPSIRQQQVFNAVLEVQQQIITAVKPGITLKQLEHNTEQLLSTKLKDMGISGPVRQFYPHGVSHHLGLDVHDAADYQMPLAEGMVITVEPGLYIPDESIGVRIEDDILVTDTGALNLSKKVPHDLLYYI